MAAVVSSDVNITTLSQFFILSPRGDTIIKREYRHDVPQNSPEIFFRKINTSFLM